MFEQHTADTKKFKDDLLKEVIENEVKKPLQAEEILRMTYNSCDIEEIGLRWKYCNYNDVKIVKCRDQTQEAVPS